MKSKSNNNLRIIVIFCLSILIICCLCGVEYFIGRGPKRSISNRPKAAEISALNAKNTQQALVNTQTTRQNIVNANVTNVSNDVNVVAGNRNAKHVRAITLQGGPLAGTVALRMFNNNAPIGGTPIYNRTNKFSGPDKFNQHGLGNNSIMLTKFNNINNQRANNYTIDSNMNVLSPSTNKTLAQNTSDLNNLTNIYNTRVSETQSFDRELKQSQVDRIKDTLKYNILGQSRPKAMNIKSINTLYMGEIRGMGEEGGIIDMGGIRGMGGISIGGIDNMNVNNIGNNQYNIIQSDSGVLTLE